MKKFLFVIEMSLILISCSDKDQTPSQTSRQSSSDLETVPQGDTDPRPEPYPFPDAEIIKGPYSDPVDENPNPLGAEGITIESITVLSSNEPGQALQAKVIVRNSNEFQVSMKIIPVLKLYRDYRPIELAPIAVSLDTESKQLIEFDLLSPNGSVLPKATYTLTFRIQTESGSGESPLEKLFSVE